MSLLTSTPVAFVNITNRERALSFYCETLGLELRSTDSFGDFLGLRNALLRVTSLAEHQAHGHPVLGWNVDDVVSTVRDFKAVGSSLSSTKAWARMSLVSDLAGSYHTGCLLLRP
jgi:catechol 2,3-dioxygenase-like lactoylglutathione lyase family enzyme